MHVKIVCPLRLTREIRKSRRLHYVFHFGVSISFCFVIFQSYQVCPTFGRRLRVCLLICSLHSVQNKQIGRQTLILFWKVLGSKLVNIGTWLDVRWSLVQPRPLVSLAYNVCQRENLSNRVTRLRVAVTFRATRRSYRATWSNRRKTKRAFQLSSAIRSALTLKRFIVGKGHRVNFRKTGHGEAKSIDHGSRAVRRSYRSRASRDFVTRRRDNASQPVLADLVSRPGTRPRRVHELSSFRTRNQTGKKKRTFAYLTNIHTYTHTRIHYPPSSFV